MEWVNIAITAFTVTLIDAVHMPHYNMRNCVEHRFWCINAAWDKLWWNHTSEEHERRSMNSTHFLKDIKTTVRGNAQHKLAQIHMNNLPAITAAQRTWAHSG